MGAKIILFGQKIENISQQWGFTYDFMLKDKVLNIPDVHKRLRKEFRVIPK